MARIVDVARAAGVTPAVVSRVLNGDPNLRIRPETHRRVLGAVRELQYTPNHAARALRRARVGTLGLAVHDISNPVYATIIEGAQMRAMQSGHVLLLADVPRLARDNETFARVISSGAIDGLLVLPAGLNADRVVAKAASARVPTLLVNDRSRTLGSIAVDDRAGARLATTHLLELGHREVAVLRPDGSSPRSRDRIRGFREALESYGLQPRPEHVVGGGHTPESGRVGMRRLLAAGRRPTAVFVSTVLAAVGAMTGARAAGLQMPGDLSIVGFHDVFFAENLVPPLTVVRLALREMGELAVQALLDQLDGRPARHLVVTDPPPQLIIRGSTAPPP
jgi:LacI family transcriptional regulator